jgi:exoribonuclease-2
MTQLGLLPNFSSAVLAETDPIVTAAAGILPMLPERLSTDLTCLNEGQVRVAIVTEMVVAADGTVAEFDLYRAVRKYAV